MPSQGFKVLNQYFDDRTNRIEKKTISEPDELNCEVFLHQTAMGEHVY